MKLFTALNKEVSNLSVLFTKLHHFHWYVKGKQFYQLHELFESLYDEMNERYDEFAERLLMIGGKPLSTQKAYLETASIKEATDQTLSDKEMINHVILDLVEIKKGLTEIIALAEDLNDDVTADLAIGTIASFDKHVWMLKSVIA
ncbi:MAG: DNA starvation/stationary phase protection protein [Acholeplasma sp.]|nr:DNA starvation/stationary phase protection protein [Acholeplasma sp.]